MWSDKIRSASSYYSLAALGLNLLVFILAILVVEPWKRRRLALTFEKRIQELSEETRQLVDGGIQNLLLHVEQQEELLNSMRNLLPPPPRAVDEESPVEIVMDEGLNAEEVSIGYESIPTKEAVRHFVLKNETVLVGLACAFLGAASSQVIQLVL